MPTVLACLYLRGLGSEACAPRRYWNKVESILRQSGCRLEEAARELRQAGLWLEASILEDPGRLSRAEKLVSTGRVLTAGSKGYPSRWRSALGAAAPPALWMRGAPPEKKTVTVVGSRAIGRAPRSFAKAVAEVIVELGYAVSSGGAVGSDRAAAEAAGPDLIEILPSGMEACRHDGPGCRLSLCPPKEPFTANCAMERNLLLYAMSDYSVVVHARLREGGTWMGATAALRRRVSTLLIRDDPNNPAHRALVGLGAKVLTSPNGLRALSWGVPSQPQPMSFSFF